MAELPDYLQPRYKKSTRRLKNRETSPKSYDLSSNDASSMILPKNEEQPSLDSEKSADRSSTPQYPLDSDGLTPDSVVSTELAWKAQVSETYNDFSGTRKSDVEMSSLLVIAASQDDNHNHPENSSGNDAVHKPPAKKLQNPPISPVIDTRKVSPLKLFLKKPTRLSCASGSSNPATEDGYSVKRISPLKLVIKRPPLRSPEVPAEPVAKPPESPVAPHYEKVSQWISSDLHLPGQAGISSGAESEQMPSRGIKRKHPDSRDSSFSPGASKQLAREANGALNQSFASSSSDDVPLLAVIGRSLQSALSNRLPPAVAALSDGSGYNDSGSQRSSKTKNTTPTYGMDSEEDEYEAYRRTYNIPRSRTPCSEDGSSPRYRPSDGSPIYYESQRMSSASPDSHNASEPTDDVFVAPRPVEYGFMHNNTTNQMPFASPEPVIRSEGTTDSYIDVVGSGPRVEIPVNEQITLPGNATVAMEEEQRIFEIPRELSRSPEPAEEAVDQSIIPAPEEKHASLDEKLGSGEMESVTQPVERPEPVETSVPVDAPPVTSMKSPSPTPVGGASESIPVESQPESIASPANGMEMVAELSSPSKVIVDVPKDSSVEVATATGSLPVEKEKATGSSVPAAKKAKSHVKTQASPKSHGSTKVPDEATRMDSSTRVATASDILPVEKEKATGSSVSTAKRAKSVAKSQASRKSAEPAKVADEAPTMDSAASPPAEEVRPRRSSRAVSVAKKSSVEPPPKKEKKTKKKQASPKKKKQKKTENVAPQQPPVIFCDEQPEFIPWSLDPNALRQALEAVIRAANDPQPRDRNRHIPRVPSPRRNRRQMDFACYRPIDELAYWRQYPMPPPPPPQPTAAQEPVEVKMEEPDPDLPAEYQPDAYGTGYGMTQAAADFDPDEPLFGYICPDDPTKTVIIKEEEDDDRYMQILEWSVPTIPPGTPAPISEWPFRARIGDYVEIEFESIFEMFRQDPENAELFRAYEEKKRVAAIAAAKQEEEEMFRMKPTRPQSAPAVMGIDQSMINDFIEHVHHIPDTLLGAFYRESMAATDYLLAKYQERMAALREPEG